MDYRPVGLFAESFTTLLLKPLKVWDSFGWALFCGARAVSFRREFRLHLKAASQPSDALAHFRNDTSFRNLLPDKTRWQKNKGRFLKSPPLTRDFHSRTNVIFSTIFSFSFSWNVQRNEYVIIRGNDGSGAPRKSLRRWLLLPDSRGTF